MAGLEDPARGVELDREVERRAGLDRLRLGERCAASRVAHALGDERGGAVGRDVAEADCETDHACARLHAQLRTRAPEHGDGLIQRRRGVDARERLIGTLIPGQAQQLADGVQAGLHADCGLVAEHVDPCGARRLGETAVVVEQQRSLLQPGGRPRTLGAPFARAVEPIGIGRVVALHVDDDWRFIEHAGVVIAAPVVQPAHDIGEIVDARPRQRHARHRVIPRPDQQSARRAQTLEQPQRRVGIAVAPAADQEDGTADAIDDVSDGAVAPVRAVGLMAQPLQDVRLIPGKMLLPDLRPVGQRGRGCRRQCVERDHECAVEARIEQHARVAATVVAVVGVAIVREVDRHDARQVRRCVARHLERREAAIGDADHVDVAVAPGLRGAPLDHVVPVALLAQRVLVARDALGCTGAAAVDAQERDNRAAGGSRTSASRGGRRRRPCDTGCTP